MKLNDAKKDRILRKTGGKCMFCGCPLTNKKVIPPGVKRMTHDHMVPRSKEGSTLLKNLFPACMTCNTTKRSMTLGEFRETMSQKTSTTPYQFYYEKAGIYTKLKGPDGAPLQ